MGKVLYQGKSEQGVYLIYPSKATNLSLQSRVYNHVSSNPSTWGIWHNRLGHPYAQVLQSLFPQFKLSTNKCNLISCTHCLSVKMHKISFPNSQFIESVHMFHNTPIPPIKRVELWGFIPIGIGLAEELCWKRRILRELLGDP